MTANPRILTVTLNPALDRTLGVEVLRPGAVLEARLLALTPAGKGVNVSRTLAALGVPSIATGFVGRGEAAFFRDDLECSGVDCAFVEISASTRTNTTIIDGSKVRETHLREAGSPARAEEIDRLRAVVARKAEACAFVVFSGSLPPGFSVDLLSDLIGCARTSGARVVVDAGGSVLRELARDQVFLIAPNVDELSELVGRPLSGASVICGEAACRLDDFGAVLVSRGSRGAFIVTGSGAFLAHCEYPVHVCSTVGCGDALLAGFLSALLRDLPWSAALAEAVAVATAAAVTATAAALDLSVLESARPRVLCRPLPRSAS